MGRVFVPVDKPTREDLKERLLQVIFDGQEIIMTEVMDTEERKQWENYIGSVMRLYAGFDEDSVEAENAIREIEFKKLQLAQEKELKEKELAQKDRELDDREKQTELRAKELEIEERKVANVAKELELKERELKDKRELEIMRNLLEEKKQINDLKIAKIQAYVKIGIVAVVAIAAFVAFLMSVAQFNAMMAFQASGGVWRSVRTVFDVGGGNGLINLAAKMI